MDKNTMAAADYQSQIEMDASPTGRAAAPRFARSQSQAQAYHRPSVDVADDTPIAPPMRFARSQSQPQAIVEAEQTQDEKHGITWRLKNTFLNPENIVSTWMTMGFIKAWSDKTMGAWGVSSPLKGIGNHAAVQGVKEHLPNIPAMAKFREMAYGKSFDKSQLVSSANRKPETKWEKAMAVGVTGALAQNLAFIMTKRGGEIPEGDSMSQRLWNSLRHPDKHSVHFSNATMSAFIGLIGVSRVAMGVQGVRSGEPDSVRKNAMMLISGFSALVSAPLVFSGLFSMDKNSQPGADSAAEEKRREAAHERDHAVFSGEGKEVAQPAGIGKLAASLKPGHLKEMWEYAVKHDSKGLVGRALAMTMELGFLMDGRMQLAKDPTSESAYKTVKGGMTGLALTCLQTHFVYDRLLSTAKQQSATAAR